MRALLNTIVARMRGLFRPGDLDADFEQELASHLEMAEDDGRRRGLTPEEARRAARVRLGGLAQLRESVREARGLPWFDAFALDARLGLRMLRRSWGLTLAGGLAMTIVITVAAVVFVFLDQFMGRVAPPLDEGERVVAVQTWDTEAHKRREVSRGDLERWGATVRSLEDIGGFQNVERRLVGGSGAPEWVRVAEITASGFRLARVAPLLGRWIETTDEQAGAAPVVVMGYEAWRSRFASDRSVVGTTVRLGEVAHTVVGVMPEGFAFPVNHRYWIPLRSDRSGALRAAPEGVVFARLAADASVEGAQAELSALGLLPSEGAGFRADPRRPRVVPYTFAFTDDVEVSELAWQQRAILLLVSLLLVPPCLNIAILIYARTVTRQEEFAARFALGASRGRIVMQLCVEVLMLASVAGAVALAITRPILTQVGAIIRRFPDLGGALPFWVDFGFSWRVALFVASLSVAAALIAGLVPALQATGRFLPNALRSLGSRTGIPLGATWTTLIVAQVALALAGLPAAIELTWGHLRPSILGPGFAAEEFVTARLSIDSQNVPIAGEGRADFAVRVRTLESEAVRRIESEFGENEVTTVAALPGAEPLTLIEMAPAADGPPVRGYVRANQVDRAFYRVFDVPVLGGRALDVRDSTGAATTVVDQTFARQIFGGANPLGRRIRPVPAAGVEPGPWYQIVGILADRPANTSQGRMYVAAPPQRAPSSPIQLVVHASGDVAETSRRLQALGVSLDPILRLDDVRRLDEIYGESQVSRNLTSYALAIVMLSVIVLSAAGLYALMSFTVTQRRREIGIRTALGAQPAKLLASIFARAARQVGGGVAAGIAVASFLHSRMNIEVEGGSHIPGILPVAALFIMLVGLLSAAGPARRAIRVDPTEALRDG